MAYYSPLAMPFPPLGSPEAEAEAAAVAAAAAAQSSPSSQRKRKHTAPKDYMQVPIKWGKSSRDVTCTPEQFEAMLNKSYGPRINNDGIRKSGKDKHGHTLWYDRGLVRCQACNNKRVVYGAIVQHIIGEGHCQRVSKIYKDKESITYSKLKKDGDEDVEEGMATEEATDLVTIPALPDYDSMMQGASDEKKRSAQRKTPKKNGGSKKAIDVDDSQTALTVQGGLVVNGLDIVKYIRGLEGRISELERKLAQSSTENANNTVV